MSQKFYCLFVAYLSAFLLLGASCTSVAEFTSLISESNLSRQAALIRPTAEELAWRRIPWIADLSEAVDVAAQEHRPLFIWVADDEPLLRP